MFILPLREGERWQGRFLNVVVDELLVFFTDKESDYFKVEYKDGLGLWL